MSKTSNEPLKFYKENPNAKDPFFATKGSACFDLHACLDGVEKYSVYQDTLTRVIEKPVKNGSLQIFNMERVLVPTGLIFDIEPEMSVRIHPRSGLCWKYGLTIINAEGIIDSDYKEEVFIPVWNTTNVPFKINHGDRIAQGELLENIQIRPLQVKDRPGHTTDRKGGFGSTGV